MPAGRTKRLPVGQWAPGVGLAIGALTESALSAQSKNVLLWE